ncbi:MAG TPA: DoxX family protein [Thermoanaerobaculia bacterium]|nr:DoxX family protein [Thermoanaerobaculia bacterium]
MAISTDHSKDLGKLILRLAVGGLLLFHGVAKLQNGVDWMAPLLGAVGLPAFVAYGSYLGEVVAPLLLLAGWQVRVAALLVAVDMSMAIGLALRSQIFALKVAGGGWAIELEMLFLLGALAIFCLGAGRYAVRAGSKGKG